MRDSVDSRKDTIVKKESERMAALAANSTQSIAFMNAQAQLKVAEGVANGKVHTVVVHYDFKGIVNAKWSCRVTESTYSWVLFSYATW